MEKLLKIAVVLTAYDRMTRVVKDATDSAKKSMNSAFGKGTAYMGTGIAIAASMMPAISAYAELEDSTTRLETAMMRAGAVVRPEFQAINKLAIDLGNQLPGTTADFQNMFEVMLNNGIEARTILNGVGKAAAYLSVQLKMPYEEAAKFASKLREATGVADKDMMGFLDTIARVRNLGVEASEMQYAFGRSAGSLKLLGLQGLDASKSMANLYAQLIRAGLSGETVGTGFAAIVNSVLDPKKFAQMNSEAAKLGVNLQFFKDGKFLGVENMIAQLDKLKQFNAVQRAGVVNALTGGGQDAQMLQTLINNGVAGFNKMNKQMADQATLQDKVGKQLMTLKNLWESATGTITNMLAALGAGLAPELKMVVDLMGKLAGVTQEFLSANPAFAKFISLSVVGMGVFLTAVGIVNMLKGAFIALRLVMATNPFILIATGAIMALSLIYSNWDKITAFFSKLWDGIKAVFSSGIQWLKDNWDKLLLGLVFPVAGIGMLIVEAVKKWFPDMYKAGEEVVNGLWEGMKNTFNKTVNFVKDMGTSISDGFKSVLGIKSPSKVFIEHGMNISRGAFIGMERGKNVIQRGVDSISSPRLAVKGAGVGYGGSSSVTFSINFTGPATREGADSFMAQLRKYEGEIIRMLNRADERKMARSFS